MGRPCSWPPSPCSTLLWTVPYCARRRARPNSTEQIKCGLHLRPIAPGQSRGRLGELWPMTSRTQLPIEGLPNQTERGTPAPQPQPASPLPITRLGHQHVLPSRILLRATPRRPNLAPSPELEVHGQLLHQRYHHRFLSLLPHVVAARFRQFCCLCALPWHPHPQSHSSPVQVQSGLSLARSLSLSRPGAIYGRSGWVGEGFFLARTPSPPCLGTSPLRSRPRHHFAR